MNSKAFRKFKSYLTNGEIDIEIVGDRYNCGIYLPDGIIFSQDNCGNMWLNNKPAHIEMREERQP